MGLFGFIVALLFLAVGLTIAVVVSWLLISPLILTLRGRSGAIPSRRGNSKLKKIDALLDKGRQDEALKLLRKHFSFSTPAQPEGVRKMKEFNQNILSRVLLIAEERQTRSEHIADVEHALLQRVELLQLLVKANESFQNLRSRREKAGKDFPSWSRADFESRIKEIRAELKENQTRLEQSLEGLFSAIERSNPTQEPITYH